MSVGSDVLDLLAEGELRVLGRLTGASNFTFLVEASDGRRAVPAVYKPRDGESPLWDFPPGTLYLREAAAFRLSRALGWPAVPPTVARDGPYGPGAVQAFVEADPRAHYFTLRDSRPDEFRRIAAFDVVANNADRKSGHCLLGRDGRVWAIDHGVCFGTNAPLRTVIWDFAGEPLPPGLREDLAGAAEGLRAGSLRWELVGLLSPDEVDAAAGRAERLVGEGTFPVPGPGRNHPWPLV